MSDPSEIQFTLRRPKTLVKAAQFAATDLRQKAMQRAFARYGYSPNAPLATLAAEETDLNDRRIQGDNSYPASRHVLILAAMLRKFA